MTTMVQMIRLVSVALLLVIGEGPPGMAQTTDESKDLEASEAQTSRQVTEGSFVGRLISPEPGTDSVFVAHLEDCYLPLWQRLHSDGVVSRVSVFELDPHDSTTGDSAPEYLVLTELGSHIEPTHLLNAEKASACAGDRNAPTFSVLRSALMSCTPHSCYGMPEPAYDDAATGIDFYIELIGVEESPVSRGKYRELMSKYFGPANGILVERGMLHCFVALENTEVLSDSPGAVPWNQIHISDDWDEGGPVDWDSVYVELFRSEFSCDLDSVWAELPTTDRQFADYRGRLIPGLCVR